MSRLAWLIILVLTFVSGPLAASAEDYRFLGMTVFHNNDVLLDGNDRWQTGGASWSFLLGPEGAEALPAAPGELWELRLRGQVITPDNFTAPAAWDRRAASVITTTLHNHFEYRGFDVSLGAGVAVTGAKTHLIDLQNLIHWLTPADEPQVPEAVQANQIPNAIYPTALGEVSYRWHLGEDVTLRPFAEVQAGVETYARVGVDAFWGGAFDTGVLARDGTTGFPYQTLGSAVPRGLSLTVGADAAWVFHSALLPAPDYDLTPLRLRARAGVHYQGRHASVFAGFSWLGREFTAQPEGQVVTALQVHWRF